MASYAAVDALKAMLDRDRTLEAHFIFREKLYRKAAEIIEHYVFAERLRTRAAAAAHTPEAASDSPADGVEAGVRAVLQKLKIPSGSSRGRKPLADDSFSVSLNYEPKPGNEPGVIWRLGLHRHVQSSIGPHTTDRYQILDKSDVAHHGRSPWLRDQSHTLAAAPIDRHAPSIAAVLRKAAKKRAEDKAVAFEREHTELNAQKTSSWSEPTYDDDGPEPGNPDRRVRITYGDQDDYSAEVRWYGTLKGPNPQEKNAYLATANHFRGGQAQRDCATLAEAKRFVEQAIAKKGP